MISERGETRLSNANAKHQPEARTVYATDYGFDKERGCMLKYPPVSNEHHFIAAAVEGLDAASRIITK